VAVRELAVIALLRLAIEVLVVEGLAAGVAVWDVAGVAV